jgi:hypothetical protein
VCMALDVFHSYFGVRECFCVVGVRGSSGEGEKEKNFKGFFDVILL